MVNYLTVTNQKAKNLRRKHRKRVFLGPKGTQETFELIVISCISWFLSKLIWRGTVNIKLQHSLLLHRFWIEKHHHSKIAKLYNMESWINYSLFQNQNALIWPCDRFSVLYLIISQGRTRTIYKQSYRMHTVKDQSTYFPVWINSSSKVSK